MTVPTRTTRQTRSWAAVLAVGAAAGAGFAAVGVPSPVLFGALLGGMVHALTTRHPAEMPPWLFRLGQALVGVTIGALVKLPTLARLGTDWPSVLLVTVATLAISLLAGRLLALRRDVSPTTGVFAMIAGGASGIVALARELGADDRVVTVVQYLRVLLVLLAMPLVTALFFHPATGVGTLQATRTRLGPDLAFVALAVGAGMLVTGWCERPRWRCSARCWSPSRSRPAGCWVRWTCRRPHREWAMRWSASGSGCASPAPACAASPACSPWCCC